MKRTHAAAFQKDALQQLPKECEDLLLGFLSVVELCRTVAPASSRLKAIVYHGKNWRNIKLYGLQNERTLSILRLHGRKMDSLRCNGMRISRRMCNRFAKCARLRSLDLTGIWKSSAVDKRFVAVVAKLPLKRLLFGQNEVCDEGFDLLCNKMPSLEELDFNSKRVSARSLYNVCMLTNLKSLCLRSCAKANEDTIRSLCRLSGLKTLQLSFLPMLHCASLRHLYSGDHPMKKLQTLVLNGMHLDRRRMQKLSLLEGLRTLSLCHPKTKSNDLELLRLPLLELLTIFCSNELERFDFLEGMPSLRTLCLYRCAASNRSLMQWAQKRPCLQFRLFAPRRLRRAGVPCEDEEIDYERYQNVSKLQLMCRPYPVFL